MGSTNKRIHTDLVDLFGNIGREFADKIKREYKLRELFVSDVTVSQLVALKFKGVKSVSFRVRKTGLNTGVLELNR